MHYSENLIFFRNGMKISRIGLGTWAIGGGPAWGGDSDIEESIKTIQVCPGLGINLIDTAPAYNFGNSEIIVGKALRTLQRERIIIITKCGITWTKKGSNFNKVGDVQLYKNLSRESIEEDIQMSLARLETDYIDIYMTHWQSVEPFYTPISETMDVLNSFKEKGVIRAIGAANVTPEHIEEYMKYGQLDIIQCKYSILDRKVEQGIFPLCEKYGITMQAYSPLEQGLLTGKINKDYLPQKGSSQQSKFWFQHDNLVKAIGMLEKWGDLCKKYDCTIPNLAIAWILAQAEFITVLSGAKTRSELMENVKALQIELSDEDIKFMKEMAEAIS